MQVLYFPPIEHGKHLHKDATEGEDVAAESVPTVVVILPPLDRFRRSVHDRVARGFLGRCGGADLERAGGAEVGEEYVWAAVDDVRGLDVLVAEPVSVHVGESGGKALEPLHQPRKLF